MKLYFRWIGWLLLWMLLLGCAGCSTGETQETGTNTEEGPAFAPAVFLSTPEKGIKFRLQSESAKVYSADALDRGQGIIIDIGDSALQSVLGFGISLTDASIHNLWLMPEEIRDSVMTRLFSEDGGIGLNILRQPVGISDFSTDPYLSYVPVPGDTQLQSFSLGIHNEKLIPLLQQARDLIGKDRMKIFLASWTPPLWMKTLEEVHSVNSSTLKTEYYDLYAQYLVRVIQAYEEAGLPVFNISPQNEFTGVHGIPAMYMSVANMERLINFHLKPALDAAGLSTGILCWDFNYFDDSIMILSSTRESVSSIGYHVYNGDPEMIRRCREMFPEIPLYITEDSCTRASADSVFFGRMENICTTFRYGASSYIMWNAVLDQFGGPQLTKDNGEYTHVYAQGTVEWNTVEKQVSYMTDYYAIGHFSKFIRPGAQVLPSTDTAQSTGQAVYNLVCRNENGSITAVLSNNDVYDHVLKLVWEGQVVECSVPAKSAVTVTWSADLEERK